MQQLIVTERQAECYCSSKVFSTIIPSKEILCTFLAHSNLLLQMDQLEERKILLLSVHMKTLIFQKLIFIVMCSTLSQVW